MKGLLILGLRKHSFGYLWLLSMANMTVNLNSDLLALEIRASNLGPSAIAWGSHNVAFVSKSTYEMDRGKLRPSFLCESP